MVHAQVTSLLNGCIPLDWLTAATPDHCVPDVANRVSLAGLADPLASFVGEAPSVSGVGPTSRPHHPQAHPFSVSLYNWLEWVVDRELQLKNWQQRAADYRAQDLDVSAMGVQAQGLDPMLGLGVDVAGTRRRADPTRSATAQPGGAPGGLAAFGLPAAPPPGEEEEGAVITTPIPPVVWLAGLHHPQAFVGALHRSLALRLGYAADELELVARVTNKFDRTLVLHPGEGGGGGGAPTGLHCEGACACHAPQ
jgi:hypothetical protein